MFITASAYARSLHCKRDSDTLGQRLRTHPPAWIAQLIVLLTRVCQLPPGRA